MYICATKFETMLHILRELNKFGMFVVLWGFPIFLSLELENTNFLWFFVVSLLGTVGVFNHYEDLARIETYGETEVSSTNLFDMNEDE